MCDKGLRIKGRLLTGVYGDGEDGARHNKLSGPALMKDDEGYNMASCDYAWQDPEDNVYKTHATASTATCNMKSNLRYGNYHFGTATLNNGEGTTSSIFTYPGENNKFYSFTVHNQVEGVSPATGSAGGGSKINVQGPGFDAAKYEVFVGGQPCADATTSKLDSIDCVVPAEKTCSGWTPGARGASFSRVFSNSYVKPEQANFMKERFNVTFALFS